MAERPPTLPEGPAPPASAAGAEGAARSVAQALGDAAQALIGALPPAVTGPPMAGAAKARWNETCGGTDPLRPYGKLRLDTMWRGARGVRGTEELAGEDLFGMARDAARDAAAGQAEEAR